VVHHRALAAQIIVLEYEETHPIAASCRHAIDVAAPARFAST
jgi:hypothetical protein